MLVPLQGTLPGWPTVQTPSAVQVLGLLIGVPAVIFIIISLIAKSKELIRAGRGEDRPAVGEPLWLGAAPADRSAITSGEEPASVEGRRAVTSSATTSEPATKLGGASVRW